MQRQSKQNVQSVTSSHVMLRNMFTSFDMCCRSLTPCLHCLGNLLEALAMSPWLHTPPVRPDRKKLIRNVSHRRHTWLHEIHGQAESLGRQNPIEPIHTLMLHFCLSRTSAGHCRKSSDEASSLRWYQMHT